MGRALSRLGPVTQVKENPKFSDWNDIVNVKRTVLMKCIFGFSLGLTFDKIQNAARKRTDQLTVACRLVLLEK